MCSWLLACVIKQLFFYFDQGFFNLHLRFVRWTQQYRYPFTRQFTREFHGIQINLEYNNWTLTAAESVALARLNDPTAQLTEETYQFTVFLKPNRPAYQPVATGIEIV